MNVLAHIWFGVNGNIKEESQVVELRALEPPYTFSLLHGHFAGDSYPLHDVKIRRFFQNFEQVDPPEEIENLPKVKDYSSFPFF